MNTTGFDPNAAADPSAGIFGLPGDLQSSRVAIVPVPFDATTSYGRGTARGPAAIREASVQVDLFDIETGRPYQAGLYMLPEQDNFLAWNAEATPLAERIIERGGRIEDEPELQAALDRVNELSSAVDDEVHRLTTSLLAQGKIVVLVGGDHSVPFGALRAHVERWPGLGILHFDAHADLRLAYEGFVRSHASIMNNVLRSCRPAKLVQVGIRDLSEQEYDIIRRDPIVSTHFDVDLRRARREGERWSEVARRIVDELPSEVYISFDIDALDPTLCPSTGTPVPSGLAFDEACSLIAEVARSGRRIVGCDLVEVAPGSTSWDANVGARLLYKLIGWTLVSQGLSTPPR